MTFETFESHALWYTCILQRGMKATRHHASVSNTAQVTRYLGKAGCTVLKVHAAYKHYMAKSVWPPDHHSHMKPFLKLLLQCFKDTFELELRRPNLFQHDSALRHNECIICQVWKRRHHLHWTPLGWIRTLSVPQANSLDITARPKKCSCG